MKDTIYKKRLIIDKVRNGYLVTIHEGQNILENEGMGPFKEAFSKMIPGFSEWANEVPLKVPVSRRYIFKNHASLLRFIEEEERGSKGKTPPHDH